MTKDVFCDWVGNQIKCRYVRRELLRELAGHIEDHQAELEAAGLSPQEAETRAVAAMGDPVEIGRALDRLYDPRWYALLRVLGWVVVLAAAWTLITGARVQFDGPSELVPLFLPQSSITAQMETGSGAVVWEGVCRDEEQLGDYTLSIPAAALILSDYGPDGTREPTYYLRGVFRADHWQPWLWNLDNVSMTLTLFCPAGTTVEEYPFSLWSGYESLFSSTCQFQLAVPDPDAEWFELTLECGGTTLTFPISRKEANS